jgi:hypothetical protein
MLAAPRVFLLTAELALLAAPGAAHAGFVFEAPSLWLDSRPIEDQLEIVVRERELLAIDAWSQVVTMAELARDEEVIHAEVRGRVALAITDRRLLATVPGSSNWAEREIEVSESMPDFVVLGDRVALVATDRHVFGFEGVTGTWSVAGLHPRESVLRADAGTNVAVAVTRTRVFGEAAARGGLFQEELGIREEANSLRAHGSFATVTTKRRILTFRAPDGVWQSTDLSLR